jgi:ribosomal protein S18 acetylase RimI-like enzyme
MNRAASPIVVRPMRLGDFEAIEQLSRIVYPSDVPWTADYLQATHEAFPEGQLVAVDEATGRVVGMAASLIVSWDDYGHMDSYQDFTGGGYFTNHDPSGRTLYGAEVMVDPAFRRRRVGSKLYAARRALVERLGLLRIRAGARLPGYHRHADRMSAEEYVTRVVRGELTDPTLSFQLRHGFEVIDIVSDYFLRDPKSRGYAALIEWINEKVAAPQDVAGRNRRFQKRPPPA